MALAHFLGLDTIPILPWRALDLVFFRSTTRLLWVWEFYTQTVSVVSRECLIPSLARFDWNKCEIRQSHHRGCLLDKETCARFNVSILGWTNVKQSIFFLGFAYFRSNKNQTRVHSKFRPVVFAFSSVRHVSSTWVSADFSSCTCVLSKIYSVATEIFSYTVI
jgi:hypothetical protein